MNIPRNEFIAMTEQEKWTHNDSHKMGPFNTEWVHIWTDGSGKRRTVVMENDDTVTIEKMANEKRN